MPRQNSKIGHLKHIIGSCVLVLAIAVIVTAAYRLSNNNEPTKPSANKPASVVGIISSLGTSLPAAYTFLHSVSGQPAEPVGYEVSGYNFQISFPATSPNITFSDTSTTGEQTAYDELSKVASYTGSYLTGQGFAAVSSQDQTSGFLSADYFYKRSDAVCHVAVYSTLSIVCSNAQALLSTSVQAEPLVDAYKTIAAPSGTLLVAAPDIRASQSAGYSIATLLVFSSNGQTNVNLYMRGRTVWHVVPLNWYNDPHENGDILPNCADFESSASIGQAFAGTSCYDSATRASSSIHAE